MHTPTTHDIDTYLRHLRDDVGHADRTIQGYRAELRLLVTRAVPLDPEALARFISQQANGLPLAPSSRNRRLSIVRGFVRYLVAAGLLAADPSLGVRRSSVPRRRRAALTSADVTRLVESLLTEAPSWRRTRDGTLLLLFFYTGLRLTEVTRLNADQVDLGAGVLRAAVRKGGDITDVVLHPTLGAQLAIWMALRPAAADGSLFPGGNRSRLTGRRIQKRLQELGRRARLGVPLHPHLLRHAHATGLLREGVATAIIQESMNHRALATTERYLHGDLELVREAVRRLDALPLVPAGPWGRVLSTDQDLPNPSENETVPAYLSASAE
jgi:integrase/recombinase XerC